MHHFNLFIRSLIFTIYLVVFTIPYGTVCLISFPFLSIQRRYQAIAAWCRVTLWMLRAINGVRYQVQGFDNLPTGPAVILVKHQSAWETLALPALLPRRLCFVLKREVLFIPFFGWVLGLVKMVHIDRKKTHLAVNSLLQQGRTRLAEGAWVILFPEGTRVPPGSQGTYKTGGARFAIDAGVPIIPIAHNAGHAWPRSSFLKYPSLVTISIGAPIDTTGLSVTQANARVEEWIETEMRRIDPAAYSHNAASSI